MQWLWEGIIIHSCVLVRARVGVEDKDAGNPGYGMDKYVGNPVLVA